MNVTNFSMMIEKGMNNPECAFFVGNMTGSFISFKYLIVIMVFVVIYKILGNVTQGLIDNTVSLVKKLYKKSKDRTQK